MADWPYNTATWRKLREAHLARFPFCEGHEAMGNPYVVANTVDHRHAIKDGGPAFPSHEGLASYCPSCHSAKTARGREAGAIKSTKPRKGCNPDGSPLDPAHPWNEGKAAPTLPPGAGANPLPETTSRERMVNASLRGKSLRAGDGRPARNRHTQLVTKRNRPHG